MRNLCAAGLLVLVSIQAMAATAAPREAEARCARLEGRIAELRLKLRMGYTAKQGRVYRQRLAALQAEHRAGCR